MSGNVPRDSEGKRTYTMDFIPDKQLYAAVMFARRMIREGTPPGVAITRSANHYGYEVGQVAHYVGQAGGTHAQRKRSRDPVVPKPESTYEDFRNTLRARYGEGNT